MLDRLKEVLHYDHESGLFSYLTDRGNVKAGDMTSPKPNGHGYLRVNIDGKSYYAHRLAFLYMTGEWPRNQIDHINADKTDNRWENLRDATYSQNHANKSKLRRNTSGFKGVRKHRSKWQAIIGINGRTVPLGTYPSPELAHAAYVETAKMVYGKFARSA